MRSCLPSPNKYRSKSESPGSVNLSAPSHDRLHGPYAVRVFANTAVAREVAHVQTIDDRFAAPLVLQDIQGIHLILRSGVRSKVREHHEGLPVAQQAVDHRLGVIGTPRREVAGLDEFQGALELGIGIELASRLIARAPRRDLFRGEPEN